MTLKLTQLSLLCPVCGAEVPPSGKRGPRRTYCSEACKQAAIDAVFAGRPEDLPRQGPSGRCRRRRLEGCGVEVEGPRAYPRPLHLCESRSRSVLLQVEGQHPPRC